MAGGDIIMLRQRELKRLHVIRKVLEGTMTQKEAAGLISLTERQIRRIVKRIRKEGDEGIRHKSEAGHQTESSPSSKGSSGFTGSTTPTSVLPSLPRNLQNGKGLPSAGRRPAPGSWKKGYGRSTAKGRPTDNGGRERTATGRCSRWTAPTTTGLKAEDRSACSWPISMMPQAGLREVLRL